jgi:hypothetical protein
VRAIAERQERLSALDARIRAAKAASEAISTELHRMEREARHRPAEHRSALKSNATGAARLSLEDPRRPLEVHAPGASNATPPSAPNVANRRENDQNHATKGDAKQREVSASAASSLDRPRSMGDDVEAALAKGLAQAAAPGRFDVVAQIARDLEARRLARAGNVVRLDDRERKRKR